MPSIIRLPLEKVNYRLIRNLTPSGVRFNYTLLLHFYLLGGARSLAAFILLLLFTSSLCLLNTVYTNIEKLQVGINPTSVLIHMF